MTAEHKLKTARALHGRLMVFEMDESRSAEARAAVGRERVLLGASLERVRAADKPARADVVDLAMSAAEAVRVLAQWEKP